MALGQFAVVDVETSGLNESRHRLLQVAVIRIEADGTVLDEWESNVRLAWPLGRVGPTHVHGIRRRDLRGAPRLAEVVTEVTNRIDGALFVGHNARFDGEFLRRAARRSGVGASAAAGVERRLCTLRMSRRLDPERVQSHRLGDVCDRYGVPLANPHEALADARATAAVLPHLLQAHEVTTQADLERYLARTDADPPRRLHRLLRQT